MNNIQIHLHLLVSILHVTSAVFPVMIIVQTVTGEKFCEFDNNCLTMRTSEACYSSL
jgi:hypothetical protein